MTILIIENEKDAAELIRKKLEQNYFTAELVHDGKMALEKAEINSYDLIILNLIVPGIGGLEVCQKIRKNCINTPIIILSKKDDPETKIKCLDAGADDYLTKPFSIDELIARIRALLRREKIMKEDILRVGDLILDTVSHEVYRQEKTINLSQKEYRILDYMMRRPGFVCTRTMLKEHVWGFDYTEDSNIVDVYISHLRKKIDGKFDKKLLHTIRDVGYKIEDKK